MKFYKATDTDGFDYHTHSINYLENIGKSVKPKGKSIFNKDYQLCTEQVLHACKNPLDLFKYAGNIKQNIYFEVEGKPVVSDESKYGFKKLEIVRQIHPSEYDELFGFKYIEACNPFDPRSIKNPKVSDIDLKNLKVWASVRVSVWESVWKSVRASVRDSVRASVWESVRASVRASVWESVRASVRASVWESVWASVCSYYGTLFPKIKTWEYTENLKIPGYPFQSNVDLLKNGLIPAYYEDKWHLYTCHGKMLWEGKI